MANELRIRIGASLDASVANAFTQVEKAAAHAAAVIRKEMSKAGADAARALAHSATASAGVYRQTGAAANNAAGQTQAAAKRTASALGQLATGNVAQFRALAQALQAVQAQLGAVAAAGQRATNATGRLGGGGRHSRFWFAANGNLAIKKPHLETLDMDPVRGAARFGMGAVGFMRRTAIGLASAAGVQTDPYQLIGTNVREEAIAQQISNAAYMPGASGPNGRRVTRGELLEQTRGVAIDTGTERGEVLAGLSGFVGKTGDLQLGRDILGDMAKLSRATGSNLEDMVNAAADVANNLGDIPDKGQQVSAIMRQIAGQGKLGAVEIRDLATQMAKLASQASKFQGGAAANIPILGVLAQEAKLRGGATNAAQASTSVVRFVEELQKPQVLRHLTGAGINPYADLGGTTLKDPRQIIREMLSWSHGDLRKIARVMPSSVGMKPLEALASVYNEARGVDADKIAAVNDEFDRMLAARLTEQEVARAFAASMETTEAKTKRFNEQIGAAAEQVAGALLPALLSLTPALAQAANDLAGAFSKFLGFDPHADEDARKQRTREDMASALEKELGSAKGAKLKKGEFPLAYNDLTHEWVNKPAGAVDRSHVEKVAGQAGEVAATIAENERQISIEKAELRSGILGPSEQGEKATDVQRRENENAQLKETYARQTKVLEAIHLALVSGQVRVEVPPAPPPPTNTEGTMPAQSQ